MPGVVTGTVVAPPPAGGCAQVIELKRSLIRVTAPVRARARPWIVTPLFTVIDASAMMFPRKTEPEPSVAELPTCQNTLHSCAPLMSVTVLADAVMSVESVWKMNTESRLPAPSRTSGPVRLKGEWLGPE